MNAPARYLSPPALQLREKLARLLAMRLKAMPEEERTRPVRVKLSKYCAEELYEVGSQLAQEAWPGVQALEDVGLVRIQYGTRRAAKGAAEAWHRDPIVEAQAGSYEALAEIGGVVLKNPAMLHLTAALLTSGMPEELAKLIAIRAPPALLALPAHEAVPRIEALRRLAQESPRLYLREASARLFESRSKILDGREDWITAVLGAACPWQDKPIQLQVTAGIGSLQLVLFVENLVTFERLHHQAPAGTALIYSAGFKASAERIAAGEVSWYLEHPTHDYIISALKAALFETGAGRPAIAFFGDLDYSGMAILKSLRQSWPHLTAWKTGYAELLSLLEAGRGHPPESADKTEQKDPGFTGCAYADEVLLPALRAYRAFVDQEALHLV
jgi:Uncharacterized protein conserved in bacteria C-term(DUF2220)